MQQGCRTRKPATLWHHVLPGILHPAPLPALPNKGIATPCVSRIPAPRIKLPARSGQHQRHPPAMHAPLALGLLAALLAAAAAQGTTATACSQCKSRGAGGCSGGSQPCGSVKGACLSVWEANTLVKERTENTGKFFSCIPSGVSARNISLFFGSGLYVHIQSQVCTADSCNSDIQPTWPLIKTVYTGGRCPACFAPGRDNCSINETLQCEGRASRCISINGRISEDDITIPFAAKGCATPHACTLEKGVTLDSGVFSYQIAQVECYPPSGAEPTRGPLVLASLAGLLAVKVLS